MISDPAVSALLLVAAQTGSQSEAEQLLRPWLADPNLPLAREGGPGTGMAYAGKRANGIIYRLVLELAHDTFLLRLTLRRRGLHPPRVWVNLRDLLDRSVSPHLASPPEQHPWAVTHIYHATIPSSAPPGSALQAFVAAGLVADLARASDSVDNTHYGWLLHGSEGAALPGQNNSSWQRVVALVTPEDRADGTRRVFLEPLTQGLARIELYLHKASHHIREYETTRDLLMRARSQLESLTLDFLRRPTLDQVQGSHHQLENIAERLMYFLAHKGQAEIVLGSLHANLESLQKHLEHVKLQSAAYQARSNHLSHATHQLETDLRYAQTTLDATQNIQEIQRSVETARMERTSFLLGSAAALLTGIAILDNFLEIWVLSVQDSGFRLPPPSVRLGVALLAAVASSLGAYWIIQGRRRAAIAAVIVVSVTVVLALVSTALVNP